MKFQPPTADILFAIRTAAGSDAFGVLDRDTIAAIIAEAGRFAADELAPLNRVGDRTGARFDKGAVTMPPGWKDAYRRWAAAGWNGLGAPTQWGGQGLPVLVQMAVQDIWNGANAAFAGGPMLTMGAIAALDVHGDAALKTRFLPKLVSGEWMATMNLTEPQAGSDLGALTTRAAPAGDGTYRLFGQKIFITYGEHDLTDNIIHLVLARLDGAPAGSAGISLFLVPKVLADGSRNDVAAAGIEAKLGLHASPTCTMVFGAGGRGATGWMIGGPNGGLAAMFTMMNIARLTVGMQGVGVAERASQEALAYAQERRQGRAPGAIDRASRIVEHPDVQRNLLRMRGLTAASRAICYACAAAIDRGETARAGVLTPIAKAFATDAAVETASLGIQVYGGAGYIDESGAAQHLRDARVFPIYEGTNGIQAIDLVTRKLRADGGAAAAALAAEIGETAAKVAAVNRADFGATAARLKAAAADVGRATRYLTAAAGEGRQADALAGATPYLRLFALAYGGALLARGALAANGDETEKWVALARFFAETCVGETTGLAAVVTEGAEGLRRAAATNLPD